MKRFLNISMLIILFIGAGIAIWLLTRQSEAFPKRFTGGAQSFLAGHRELLVRSGRGVFFFHPSRTEMKKIRSVMMMIHQKQMMLGLEQMKEKIELAQILLGPKPTKAALDNKLAKILSLQKEKQENLVDAYFKIRSELKPDERAPFTWMIIHHILGGPFIHPMYRKSGMRRRIGMH
ncbi:MAG: hypothetical protein M1421_07835 [Candidatus Eremiobacteraeota bacterium]|nr:hypothetical protein [Candidatus Eremiobacteraeota bacterium]